MWEELDWEPLPCLGNAVDLGVSGLASSPSIAATVRNEDREGEFWRGF